MTKKYLVAGIVVAVALAGALGWASAGAPGAPTWMRGRMAEHPMEHPMGDDMERTRHGAMHGGSGQPGPAGTDVAIRDSDFEPRELRVRAGDTVTWTNLDGYGHTVTADDGSFRSITLAEGDSFSSTFMEPGTYPYHCDPHAYQDASGAWLGQTGVVIVE